MDLERGKEGFADGGVSRSSDEAGNDRGAKGWQRVIAKRGDLWPYTVDGKA